MKIEPALRISSKVVLVNGQVFGSDAVDPLSSLLWRVCNQQVRIAADRLPCDHISFAGDCDCGLNALSQCQLRCNQHHYCVGIVLCLRHHVGGKKSGIAFVAVEDGFGRTGKHIDGAVGARQLLGGGDKTISRANDFIHTRNRFRSVRERCDCLCTSTAIHFANAKQSCRGQRCRLRARRDDTDARHTRNLRGNYRHQLGRGKGIAAAGDVATNRVQRPHDLAKFTT